MTNERLTELIDESIRIEQNVSSLYVFFAENLPLDHDFWWQLHLEEKSHAMLLRTGRDSFIKRGKFPRTIIGNSIDELTQSNIWIEEQIQYCKDNRPSRSEACKIAVKIEQQAGEKHYTLFMDKDVQSGVETVFQQLNRDDKDHECRIRQHLESLPSGS
jgi:hypothetical protein